MTLLSSARQAASRMIRASLGEKELYWELALDPRAIRQSMLAVLIVAAAWGIGAATALMAFMWTAMAAAVAIRYTLESTIGAAIMVAFCGMTLGLLVLVFARVYVLP